MLRISYLLIVCLPLAMLPISAEAATATSTGRLDWFYTGVPLGATRTIYVDAISKLPNTVNATTAATLNGAVIPFVPGGVQTTYFWPFRGFWGPTVTSGVLPKAVPFISDLVTSSTASVTVGGRTFATSSRGDGDVRNLVGGRTALFGSATVTINFEAFARAEDPIFFEPGSNTLSETLEAGTQLSSTDQSSDAGLDFFMTIPLSAYPGRVCNVAIASDCLLLAISASASGVLASPSDFSILVYTDPVTSLDAFALAAALAGDFTVSDNTAVLNTDFVVPPFTLNVATPYSIDLTFDGGVDADTIPTPEPGTLLLIASSFVGFVLARGRASWRNSSSAIKAARLT